MKLNLDQIGSYFYQLFKTKIKMTLLKHDNFFSRKPFWTSIGLILNLLVQILHFD